MSHFSCFLMTRLLACTQKVLSRNKVCIHRSKTWLADTFSRKILRPFDVPVLIQESARYQVCTCFCKCVAIGSRIHSTRQADQTIGKQADGKNGKKSEEKSILRRGKGEEKMEAIKLKKLDR